MKKTPERIDYESGDRMPLVGALIVTICLAVCVVLFVIGLILTAVGK